MAAQVVPEEQSPLIQFTDIKKLVGSEKKLNDNEKYDALTKTWTPGEGYPFPRVLQNGSVRSLQPSYLKSWEWLAHSEVAGGGAFCKACVLSACNGSGRGAPEYHECSWILP